MNAIRRHISEYFSRREYCERRLLIGRRQYFITIYSIVALIRARGAMIARGSPVVPRKWREPSLGNSSLRRLRYSLLPDVAEVD